MKSFVFILFKRGGFIYIYIYKEEIRRGKNLVEKETEVQKSTNNQEA